MTKYNKLPFWFSYILLCLTAGVYFSIASAISVYVHKSTVDGLDYTRGIKCGVAELFEYHMRVYKRCIKHLK